MNLAELLTKPVVTAEPADTIAEVARMMHEHNVGSVVIVEKERPVGILTDRDLCMALAVKGVAPDAEAQTVMTRHVIAVPETTDIFGATRFMKECGVRRLPVVDRDDRLVGMISLDDVLRCLGRELENVGEAISGEMTVRI